MVSRTYTRRSRRCWRHFTSPTEPRRRPGPPEPQSKVLFQDVRIFDGKSGSLSAPSNVLVRGNKNEMTFGIVLVEILVSIQRPAARSTT